MNREAKICAIPIRIAEGYTDKEIWTTSGDHEKFVKYWNHERPNGAIGYLYPAEVFIRNRKRCH